MCACAHGQTAKVRYAIFKTSRTPSERFTSYYAHREREEADDAIETTFRFLGVSWPINEMHLSVSKSLRGLVP